MIDEKRIEHLMKSLKISREEAIELEGYDEEVNSGKNTDYDLSPEQQKVVSQMTRAENTKGKVRRTRKPNELKESIVRELAEFLLEDAQGQLYENVEIVNVNRTIAFAVNGKRFEINLIEKREPKN